MLAAFLKRIDVHPSLRPNDSNDQSDRGCNPYQNHRHLLHCLLTDRSCGATRQFSSQVSDISFSYCLKSLFNHLIIILRPLLIYTPFTVGLPERRRPLISYHEPLSIDNAPVWLSMAVVLPLALLTTTVSVSGMLLATARLTDRLPAGSLYFIQARKGLVVDVPPILTLRN